MGIVTDLVYIVIAALIGGFFALLIRQPLIIGYIFAGVIVGPYTAGPTVERAADIQMLAEVGVALLLFTLGLEFSFGELRRLFRLSFIGVPLQLLLTSTLAYLLMHFLGYPTSDATWIAAAVGLSSTMVVLKTLTARDSLQTDAGRSMLAILVAQDLAVIPMLLILPQLTGENIDVGSVLTAGVKSILFLSGMFIAGTRILPWVFQRMSQLGSRELLFLTTLSVALGTGFISHELGLSFALGAFVAGMLLSETDFSKQALSDVASLRDLFSLIFFVSVGMLFNPRFFIDHLGEVLLFTAIIIAVKALVITSISRIFGNSLGISCLIGCGLAQVGEFAFVIATAGMQTQQISSNSYYLIIAVTVVSMIATPGLFWIGTRLGNKADYPHISSANFDRDALSKDHVIVIGGGVVGSFIARVLATLRKPCIVIEMDYRAVRTLRQEGVSVLFGDASRSIILEAAAIHRARLVVVTATNNASVLAVLEEVRRVQPNIPIAVRVAEIGSTQQLAPFNVQEIVQPQLEAGLEFIRQSLRAIGMDEPEIFPILAELRARRYAPVTNAQSERDAQRLGAAQLLQLIWIDITDQSPLIDRTLKDLQLPEVYGVYIAALIRGNDVIANPGSDVCLQQDDVIGMLGTHEKLQTFRANVLSSG